MANVYATYGWVPMGQMIPIPGREADMVANNAGGFTFILNDWELLHRFLILGSEVGTYYVGQKQLTEQNAQCIVRCITEDGIRVVHEALRVNAENLAPKVEPQLFALALCLKHGDLPTRRAVEAAARRVLRTGMYVLQFAAMVNSLTGWGDLKKRIFTNWFLEHAADDTAFQVLKYQSRGGWTQRDVLRLTHPKTISREQDAVAAWVTDRGRAIGLEPALTMEKRGALPQKLAIYDAIMAMEIEPIAKALDAIEAGLPREALPTEALANAAVWRALLPHTPPHALLRNLGVVTANGALEGMEAHVASRLGDLAVLRKAKVHPFAILLAALVYRTGQGVKGKLTWNPSNMVLSALEDAYDVAFEYIEPTNKRLLIGVDTSGSMSSPCMSMISAASAAAAMAVTLARTEPHATVVQFDTEVRKIMPVTKRTSINSMGALEGGGTDVSSTVRWALNSHQYVDAFIILTDNETWAGNRHTSQVLEEYRNKVNSEAKLVCCSLTANHANIVDPNDSLSMGCAGLDANLPSLVAQFIKGY